jgi:hypothetical protein
VEALEEEAENLALNTKPQTKIEDRIRCFLSFRSILVRKTFMWDGIFRRLCGQTRGFTSLTSLVRCNASAAAVELSAGRVIADANMDELTRTMVLELPLRGKGRANPRLAIAQKDQRLLIATRAPCSGRACFRSRSGSPCSPRGRFQRRARPRTEWRTV